LEALEVAALQRERAQHPSQLLFYGGPFKPPSKEQMERVARAAEFGERSIAIVFVKDGKLARYDPQAPGAIQITEKTRAAFRERYGAELIDTPRSKNRKRRKTLRTAERNGHK
jgi:hypothetical protein